MYASALTLVLRAQGRGLVLWGGGTAGPTAPPVAVRRSAGAGHLLRGAQVLEKTTPLQPDFSQVQELSLQTLAPSDILHL